MTVRYSLRLCFYFVLLSFYTLVSSFIAYTCDCPVVLVLIVSPFTQFKSAVFFTGSFS